MFSVLSGGEGLTLLLLGPSRGLDPKSGGGAFTSGELLLFPTVDEAAPLGGALLGTSVCFGSTPPAPAAVICTTFRIIAPIGGAFFGGPGFSTGW